MLSSFVKTAFAVALLVGGASGAQAKAERRTSKLRALPNEQALCSLLMIRLRGTAPTSL